MNDLKNKTIVISGGAEGIGYEMADKFLQKGAKLTILLDINEVKGSRAAKELSAKYGNNKSVFIKCDVIKDLDAVYKKIVDTYKYVDVLVNNAGIMDDKRLKMTVDLNVTALMEWSFKFWDLMRKDKQGSGGTIINMSSIYGYRVDPFLPIYQASKFAVLGFTKSLGFPKNFNRTGIRVVAICPGFTETKLTAAPNAANEVLAEGFVEFKNQQAWQKVDSVGNAIVEVFENASSGTAWLIEGAMPIKEVLNLSNANI